METTLRSLPRAGTLQTIPCHPRLCCQQRCWRRSVPTPTPGEHHLLPSPVGHWAIDLNSLCAAIQPILYPLGGPPIGFMYLQLHFQKSVFAPKEIQTASWNSQKDLFFPLIICCRLNGKLYIHNLLTPLISTQGE